MGYAIKCLYSFVKCTIKNSIFNLILLFCSENEQSICIKYNQSTILCQVI